MPEPVDLGFVVKQKPRAAIRYLKSKGYTISWDWWETRASAHAKAFTAAKAVQLDVLQTIREGVDKALEQGITERQFIREIEPRLRRAGWWGRQIVVNSSGEGQVVQLGSPHRLKTIYRTNMRTAYAAARYRQQAENAESRPYWMYDARDDDRVRASHAALDGQVFRYDDEIWKTHYPPNGFNCRCRVRALTEGQVKRRGFDVGSSEGGLRKVAQEVGIDKQTGEVITRPGTRFTFRGGDGEMHTLTPDPGWSHNPGREQSLFDALPEGDSVLRDLVVGGQRDYRDFGLPGSLPVLPAPERLPKASTREEAARQIHDALGASGKRIAITRRDGKPDTIFNWVDTPEGLEDVSITESFVRHLIADHPEDRREQFANRILPVLRDPAEVWLSATQRGERIIYRRRFLATFEGGGNALAVVQEEKDGSLSWTFHAADNKTVNRRRVGFLLYRRREER